MLFIGFDLVNDVNDDNSSCKTFINMDNVVSVNETYVKAAKNQKGILINATNGVEYYCANSMEDLEAFIKRKIKEHLQQEK